MVCSNRYARFLLWMANWIKTCQMSLSCPIIMLLHLYSQVQQLCTSCGLRVSMWLGKFLFHQFCPGLLLLYAGWGSLGVYAFLKWHMLAEAILWEYQCCKLLTKRQWSSWLHTEVYSLKFAHGFVVLHVVILQCYGITTSVWIKYTWIHQELGYDQTKCSVLQIYRGLFSPSNSR